MNSPPWDAARGPALLPSTPRVDPAANRGAMRRRCTGAPEHPCHGGSREILPPCFCSHQPCLCGASWQFHTDQHSTRSTTRDARPPGSRLSSPPRPGALLLVSRISSSYPSPPWFLRRFDRWQRQPESLGQHPSIHIDDTPAHPAQLRQRGNTTLTGSRCNRHLLARCSAHQTRSPSTGERR